MADVSVNINGDASGLNSAIDSLREKAKQLNVDMAKLSEENLGKKTFTEQKVNIQQSVRELSEAKKSAVKSDYESIRKSNVDDLNQAHADFKSGKISRKTLEEQKGNFETSQKDSRTNESKEILAIEREMNQNLRAIVREMTQNRQIAKEKMRQETVAKQVDDTEHDTPHSPEDKNATIRVKEDVKEKNDKSDSSTRILSAGSSAAAGNLQGTVTNGIAGAGSLFGMSKGGAAAAGITGAIWGLASAGDRITKTASEVGSFRGEGRSTGSEGTEFYRERRHYDSKDGEVGILKTMGLEGDEFLGMMKKKAQESGRTGNLRERTLDDVAFQKGFGADVSPLNQFEKFTKNGETGLKVATDMLNVLNGIKNSSLKSTDLVSLQNKINTQATLFEIQRSKRDVVDPDNSLRMLAAFESIGLSKMGNKSGDFLSSVIGGLGEGGSDNAMLLKTEMVKRAHPELANDPVGIRKFLKYHNDDPEYMSEALRGFGEIAGDNEMVKDDLISNIFNPSSEMGYDMISKGFKSKKGTEFSNLLAGKGLNKSEDPTFTKDQMYKDAQSGTGGLTEAINGFKNIIGDLGVSVNDGFSKLSKMVSSDGTSLNVVTKAPKISPPVINNKVSTGKGTGKQ